MYIYVHFQKNFSKMIKFEKLRYGEWKTIVKIFFFCFLKIFEFSYFDFLWTCIRVFFDVLSNGSASQDFPCKDAKSTKFLTCFNVYVISVNFNLKNKIENWTIRLNFQYLCLGNRRIQISIKRQNNRGTLNFILIFFKD